jgi:hypothetical protein
MRRLFGTRNNRALSTVISTILMIMVVMIGMTLLFAYVTVYADNYKAGAGGAVLESLTIEDTFMSNANTVRVTVYNAATQANMGSNVTVEVVGIYVNGIALTNSQAGINQGEMSFDETPVGAGHHQMFYGTFNQALTHGFTYEVKVVTQRGSTFLSTVKV